MQISSGKLQTCKRAVKKTDPERLPCLQANVIGARSRQRKRGGSISLRIRRACTTFGNGGTVVNLKQKSASLWRSLTQNGISAIEHSPTFRQKGTTEPRQHYQVPGHGILFCLHERSYFVECRACKRTRIDGEENYSDFMQKHTQP